MKFIKGVMLVSTLVLTMSVSVYATESVNVNVNGESVKFDSKPYVDQNGRTMVPIAKIADIFNATTNWDNATNTVTIKDDYTVIKLKIGESKINVNGEDVRMDTQAVIKDGRTFVPISAIAKAFNVGYSWNNATNTVDIKASSLIKSDIALEKEEYSAQEYSVINRSAGNRFAYDGEYLYYSNPKDNRYLYKKNMTTGKLEKLFDGGEFVKDIYVTDKYIVFGYMDKTTKDYVLARVDKDGKNLKTSNVDAKDIQVYDDKIYYISNAGNMNAELYTLDLDFSNKEKLFDYIVEFIVADDKIIYRENGGNLDLMQIDLDMTNEELLLKTKNGDDLYRTTAVDLEKEKLYFKVFRKYNQIDRLAKDGKIETFELKNATSNGYYTVLNDKVYYNTANVGISEYDTQTGKETLIMEGNFSSTPHIIGDYIFTISGNNVVTYNLLTKEKGMM